MIPSKLIHGHETIAILHPTEQSSKPRHSLTCGCTNAKNQQGTCPGYPRAKCISHHKHDLWEGMGRLGTLAENFVQNQKTKTTI